MSGNPLAFFASQPTGVTFESQEQGEKIVLLLRAHLVTLTPSMLLAVIFFLMPIFVGAVLSVVKVDISPFLLGSQTFLIGIFWYLFVFGYAFYKFIFWYFNVYLLTNERVIDFDLKRLLHEEIAYARLGQIEDVSPKITGLFGTFFDFGSVLIQTAAERNEFEFDKVAKPDEVAREIMEQVRLEEKETPGEIA